VTSVLSGKPHMDGKVVRDKAVWSSGGSVACTSPTALAPARNGPLRLSTPRDGSPAETNTTEMFSKVP
jgi:hypothetical protein